MEKLRQPPKDNSLPEEERDGDPSGEWATETGVLRTSDMEYAKTLSKGLSLADEVNVPKEAPSERASSVGASESDPYDRVTATQPSSARQKRRSLDDMRRLSEEIKAAKNSGTKS